MTNLILVFLLSLSEFYFIQKPSGKWGWRVDAELFQKRFDVELKGQLVLWEDVAALRPPTHLVRGKVQIFFLRHCFQEVFISAPFPTKLDRQLFHVRILQLLHKIYEIYRFSLRLERNRCSLCWQD